MPEARWTFFSPGPFSAGETIDLPAEEQRHALVRRIAPGERVRLIDGLGGEAFGAVSGNGRGRSSVLIESVRAAISRTADISLLIPVLKMPRLSWLVEKGTELGASRFELAASKRTQGNRFAGASLDRGRLGKLAAEAVKQSGQIFIPEISGPSDFEALLAPREGEKFLFDPSGGPFPARLASARASLWVGPEGGFTAEELRSAERSGWNVVCLFSTILRAETAAIAALCLARSAIDTAGRPGGQ